jgi:hypothetical protein
MGTLYILGAGLQGWMKDGRELISRCRKKERRREKAWIHLENHVHVWSLRRIPSGLLETALNCCRRESKVNQNAVSRDSFFVQNASKARLECLAFPHCSSTVPQLRDMSFSAMPKIEISHAPRERTIKHTRSQILVYEPYRERT